MSFKDLEKKLEEPKNGVSIQEALKKNKKEPKEEDKERVNGNS